MSDEASVDAASEEKAPEDDASRDQAPTDQPPSEKAPTAPAPPVPVPSRRTIAERFLVDFFGAPTTGEPVALFRIAYGVLALWEALAVWINLDRYFGAHALIPFELVKNDAYIWVSPFWFSPDSNAILYGHAVVFSLAALGLLLGFYPRIMALLVCYVNVSLQLRDPFILNSGDRLFQITAGLAALMPLGRKWSVDAWLWKRRSLGQAPLGTVYGQRLLQLTICYIYISSCIAKLMSERWRQGIALRDVLSSPVFSEWPRYWDFFPVVMVLTWSTLLFEGSFPFLVWLKKWRPYMLLWGFAFHVGIDVLMVIPIFSAIMIVCYPIFLVDSEVRWLVHRVFRKKSDPPQITARSAPLDPAPGS